MTQGLSRREWLLGIGAVGAGGLAHLGCVSPTARLSAPERRLLFRSARPLPVVRWDRHRPDPGSVLRRRALPARQLPLEILSRLDALMRETLARSGGVGLAAPQVGVGRRVILVQLQDEKRRVLTLVDPRVRPLTTATEDGYEACLSVEGVGALVRRAARVQITFFDLRGRPERRISEGWEARIFQHEMDHLEGVLYLDRLLGPLLPIDEVRRRRKKARAEVVPGRTWLASTIGARSVGRQDLEHDAAHGPEGLLL